MRHHFEQTRTTAQPSHKEVKLYSCSVSDIFRSEASLQSHGWESIFLICWWFWITIASWLTPTRWIYKLHRELAMQFSPSDRWKRLRPQRSLSASAYFPSHLGGGKEGEARVRGVGWRMEGNAWTMAIKNMRHTARQIKHEQSNNWPSSVLCTYDATLLNEKYKYGVEIGPSYKRWWPSTGNQISPSWRRGESLAPVKRGLRERRREKPCKNERESSINIFTQSLYLKEVEYTAASNDMIA